MHQHRLAKLPPALFLIGIIHGMEFIGRPDASALT